MKEIMNSIGTLVVLVVLVLAIVLIPSVWVKVLSGIGLVSTMYFHDEYIRNASYNDDVDKYNDDVDRYNKEIEEGNEKIDEEKE